MRRWLLPFLLAPALAAAQGAPRTWLLVVTGVSGDPAIGQAFTRMGTQLVDAAHARFGMPDAQVTWLAEDSTRDAKRVRGRATRVNVEATLGRMVAAAGEGDRLAVLLIGHGSMPDAEARFNLVGPDMTAADFARVLAPAKATVLFANLASASGEFVKPLSGRNRVIIAATKSGREQNATRFPEPFVAALVGGVGDSDKDGRVSALEAFTWARRDVERYFDQAGLLPTEHAILEDDGDGTGHGDAGDAGPDGPRARTFFLEPLGGATVAADPRAAKLIEERRAIEARIDALRARRAQMSEADYQAALEPLVLELAEKTRALRTLEAKKP